MADFDNDGNKDIFISSGIIKRPVDMDIIGPMLSFARHTDIDITNVEDSHVERHGVIDLRDGSTATLGKIFGDSAARRLTAEGRAAYRIVVDSVRR